MVSARVMCLMVLGIVASCARATPVSQVRPISPDDPDYCDHCPCSDERPRRLSCPLNDPALCSLPALKRALPNGPYSRCGRLMLYEEGGLDHGETWLFDEATGALVAWRVGLGISAMMCRDGYSTTVETWPSRFVFPPSDTCKPAGALYGDPDP
jgi:hypothetical protein